MDKEFVVSTQTTRGFFLAVRIFFMWSKIFNLSISNLVIILIFWLWVIRISQKNIFWFWYFLIFWAFGKKHSGNLYTTSLKLAPKIGSHVKYFFTSNLHCPDKSWICTVCVWHNIEWPKNNYKTIKYDEAPIGLRDAWLAIFSAWYVKR